MIIDFTAILDSEFFWNASLFLHKDDYHYSVTVLCDRFYIFPDGSCAFEWAGVWSVDTPGNFDPEKRLEILLRY